MSAPKTIFVTGANRGIGLGFVREILKLSDVDILIAGARNVKDATELQALANTDSRLKLLAVDVTSDESLNNAVSQIGSLVGSRGLNVLINNAGVVVEYEHDSKPDRQAVLKCIDVNAVSSLLVSQLFLPLLQQAAAHSTGSELSVSRAAIINIGSDCSSQALNIPGGIPDRPLLAYKMSKVAMLSFARTLVSDFKVRSIPILVVTFHPGWVQTDMGGEEANVSVEEAAGKIVGSFATLNSSHSGGLYDRNIEPMPF